MVDMFIRYQVEYTWCFDGGTQETVIYGYVTRLICYFFWNFCGRKSISQKTEIGGINRGYPNHDHTYTERRRNNDGKFYEGSRDDGDEWKQGL